MLKFEGGGLQAGSEVHGYSGSFRHANRRTVGYIQQ